MASPRRTAVIGAAVGLAVLVVGLVALAASGAIGGGGAETALAARRARVSTSAAAGAAADAPPACRSPLAPDTPLRLWIAGDSLAGSLGPSLGERAAATGIVQPVYDSRVSSGLGTPNFFDWPKHAASEIRRLDPEVVVFIIGANDWKVPAGEAAASSDASAWRSTYAERVEAMLDVLESTGRDGRPRPVYWVGGPPMQDEKKDAGVRAVDDVARQVVAGHPEATYVDAYDLFLGSDGHFSATLPGDSGTPVLVRADDGIHFTPEGGDLLGAHVYEPLDQRCDLDGQAVPGAAKRVVRTKGSTEVAGTNRTTAPAPSPAAGANQPAGAAPTTPVTAPKAAPSTAAPTTPTIAPPSPSTTTPPTTTPTTTAPPTSTPTTS